MGVKVSYPVVRAATMAAPIIEVEITENRIMNSRVIVPPTKARVWAGGWHGEGEARFDLAQGGVDQGMSFSFSC